MNNRWVGGNCTIGSDGAPSVVAGEIVGDRVPVRENPRALRFTVVDEAFDVPGTHGCGPAGRLVEHRFGLTFTGRLTFTVNFAVRTYDTTFARIPTSDLYRWTAGPGGSDSSSCSPSPVPSCTLRRWAFQDVLLVAADGVPDGAPAWSVNFACVLSQVDGLAEACRALRPESLDGPRDTPWNTRDLEVITPGNARIVFTAGKPFDPAGPEARHLEAVGIVPPGRDGVNRR